MSASDNVWVGLFAWALVTFAVAGITRVVQHRARKFETGTTEQENK